MEISKFVVINFKLSNLQHVHIFLLILVCGDTFPSSCSFPPNQTPTCSDVVASDCETELSGPQLSPYCGSTPGKVKDYCTDTCGTCKSSK